MDSAFGFDFSPAEVSVKLVASGGCRNSGGGEKEVKRAIKMVESSVKRFLFSSEKKFKDKHNYPTIGGKLIWQRQLNIGPNCDQELKTGTLQRQIRNWSNDQKENIAGKTK
ncbi:hypothetical protein NE237_021115 [Protea cynaroides]|uniref:Uncharacterized protein n=1 Tax=Protea cynaroides TaxID=273540 RepID=A0A9Q0K426_9MAGN|nr:hypothetical protein NE237_021115 [Protea cynaroides]